VIKIILIFQLNTRYWFNFRCQTIRVSGRIADEVVKARESFKIQEADE